MSEDIEFLSDDWIAAFRQATADLPSRHGATARVDTVVVGGPGGPRDEVSWTMHIVDGRVTEAGRGAVGAVDAVGDGGLPTVSLNVPWALAVDIARGETALAVAFMQGRAKVAGDQAALLRVLALTATAEYRGATTAVDAVTSYPPAR